MTCNIFKYDFRDSKQYSNLSFILNWYVYVFKYKDLSSQLAVLGQSWNQLFLMHCVITAQQTHFQMGQRNRPQKTQENKTKLRSNIAQ